MNHFYNLKKKKMYRYVKRIQSYMGPTKNPPYSNSLSQQIFRTEIKNLNWKPTTSLLASKLKLWEFFHLQGPSE